MGPIKLNYVTLDVFTSKRYTGNQLAVITIPENLVQSITYDQKVKITQEFDYSESVFILEPNDPSSTDIPCNIHLPSTEIPFAGHPTIGTGIYLLKYQKRSIASITPKAGRVGLTYDDKTGIVSAEIPHEVHLDSHTVPMQLDLPGRDRCPIFSIVKGMTFVFVPLPDLDALAKANTGFEDPTELDDGWTDGFRGTYFYVEQGTDAEGRRLLRTRFQSASYEGFEDAATGSAACGLSSFLALQVPGPGELEVHIIQGVEMGRESEIYVSVNRTSDGKGIDSVTLKGTAVKVMEGSIEL